MTKKTAQVKPDHNLPYFPCYIADWLIDTQDLTDEQDGAYFRFVRYQWKNGSITNDKRIMRKISDSYDESWPYIEKYFVKKSNGNWYNKRTDRERNKIISKINAGSKGGSKGGSKRPSKRPSKTDIPQTSDLRPLESIPKNTHILRAHEAYRLICSKKPSNHEILQITQLVHDKGIDTILEAISVCGDFKWDKISHLKKVISGEWPRKDKEKKTINESLII